MRRRQFFAASTGLGLLALLPRMARGGSDMAGGSVAGGIADGALAQEYLREFILQHALPDANPWVAMHVVLALGAGIQRGGVNVLDSTVAAALRLEEVGMRRYPVFPLDVERHRFHFLQIMQAIDLPRDHLFVTPDGRWTRADLVESACALFDPKPPANDEDSWAISVLTHEYPPARDEFTTARGQKVDVAEQVEHHLRETEASYAAVFASMRGEGYGRNALHRRACNGLHLLYGLLDAAAAGYVAGGLRAKLARLLAATLFRARLEAVLIERSLPAGDATTRLNADAARLTFFGHLCEDFGLAIRHRLFQPDAAQLATLVWARGQLVGVIQRFVSEHDISALSVRVPRAWHVMLGDLCHAYRGLRILRASLASATDSPHG
jgi:hypothetical protein